MGSPMTAVPPLPPEVMAQYAAQQPMPAGPVFTQMGAAAPALPDPVGVLKGKVAQLEALTGEMDQILALINPGLQPLLVPIAQSGKALQSEIQTLEQRMAGPSPQVTGSAPPNVPGNIPGARPAM